MLSTTQRIRIQGKARHAIFPDISAKTGAWLQLKARSAARHKFVGVQFGDFEYRPALLFAFYPKPTMR
jgi:hypothetical protein